MPESTSARTDAVWANRSHSVSARVDALLADLDEQERGALLLADFSPLSRRDLPYPHYVDSGTGLRGVAGATAFPVGIALAATFDADLARRYGAAVGREARHAGFTCVLGPTIDLARDPRAGRIPEAFGEDAWLSGAVGAAHVLGMQGQHVIAQVKHFLAYGTEERRTGHGPVWRRGDALDVRMSHDAFDMYLKPFRAVVEAGAWSLMGSYNRIDGTYVCQSRHLLDLPRREWGWEGFYAPDFIFAVRDPQAALDAGLDLPGLDGPSGRTAAMVQDLEAERRDAMVRRVLMALFGSGLVDDPPRAGTEVSTQEHRELAREVTVASAVLLHNNGVLPLAESVKSLAVVGAAGHDAMYTAGGSSAVDLEDGRIVTPLEAIRQRAAASTTVMFAQGSLGDVPLPVVPSSAFSLPDGSGPGVELHRMGADATPRIERVTNIDITLEADDVDAVLPALIRCRLTSESSGPHRLSLDLGGGAVVRVNGLEVMAGVREASPFFHGPACPLQGIVELTAGQAVDLEIEWRIASALIVPEVGLLPRITLGWQNQATQHDEAIAVARSQDAAVVIVNMASSEGMDRSSLDLPGDQDALIAAVAAVNPQTIVILNTPGAVMMPWLDDVAAVLQVWYPGEQFGPALASMLFGDSSPGGRLPLTFPRSVEDLPGGSRRPNESPDVIELVEGNRIGYRAVGINERGALFPFGFGLSYGQTSHEVRTVRVADDIDIEMTVVNKATVAAPHVIQAYTYSSADPGQRFLSGIARTVVPPHSTVNLTLRVNRRDLDEVAPPDLRRLVIATHAFDPGIAVEEATPPSLAAPTSPTSETNEE